MDMTRLFPIHINHWIRISQCRGGDTGYCLVCGQKLGTSMGIMFKLAHDSHSAYNWCHFYCIDKLPTISVAFKYNPIHGMSSQWPVCQVYLKKHVKGAHADGNGSFCSFCEEQGKARCFGNFYIHDDCIIKAISAIKEMYSKKEPEIIARLI